MKLSVLSVKSKSINFEKRQIVLYLDDFLWDIPGVLDISKSFYSAFISCNKQSEMVSFALISNFVSINISKKIGNYPFFGYAYIYEFAEGFFGVIRETQLEKSHLSKYEADYAIKMYNNFIQYLIDNKYLEKEPTDNDIFSFSFEKKFSF